LPKVVYWEVVMELAELWRNPVDDARKCIQDVIGV
jgi:hypothetical protein